jgi:hypothetical protein
MRTVSVLIGAAFLFLALVAAVRADIPGFGPKPRRSIGVLPDHARPVVIEVDDKLSGPRLIVPKWLARLARPVAATSPGDRRGHGPAMPLPVGIAFTVSLAATGLCLVGGRKVPAVLLAAVVLCGVTGAAAVWANAPPPLRPPPKKQYPGGLPLEGVAVEFVDRGDSIRLVVPRALVADLAAKLNATEVRQ